MKKLLLSLIACFAVSVFSASAQYSEGDFRLGPVVGYSVFADLGYGFNFDIALSDQMGLKILTGYSTFSEDFSFIGAGTDLPQWEYTLISAMVAGSYHFVEAGSFDPYVSLGVGYMNWDAKYIVDGEEQDPFAGASAAYTSGVGFTGNIGAYFHFSDGVAANLALGYPFIGSLALEFSM